MAFLVALMSVAAVCAQTTATQQCKKQTCAAQKCEKVDKECKNARLFHLTLVLFSNRLNKWYLPKSNL